MVWLTVLVFVALLLVLVLVHELGHFLAARRAGCKVEEFAFGFPPRLFQFTKGDTVYSFNLIPLGGFVKIKGEEMDEAEPSPDSFGSKSASWRITILAAGVTMNIALAAVLLGWQSIVGVPTVITETNDEQLSSQLTYVLDVTPDSPAAAAGLDKLDLISQINAIANPTIEQVQQVTSQNAGAEVSLIVDRQGQAHSFTATLAAAPADGQSYLGVSLIATGLQKYPWWQAPWQGVKRAGTMLVAILVQFGIIIKRAVVEGSISESLGGPVAIAIYSNKMTQLGLSYILDFGALISLNLAIINILPFPALDGGRIMFILAEKVIGRRLPLKAERVTHTIGFALLIMLLILVTFRDVKQFIL